MGFVLVSKSQQLTTEFFTAQAAGSWFLRMYTSDSLPVHEHLTQTSPSQALAYCLKAPRDMIVVFKSQNNSDSNHNLW
jgi:hypothetical protein